MNRRDFVKALAGIPLLRLLVKIPEEGGEIKLAGYPDLVSYISDCQASETSLYERAYSELRLGAEQQPAYELDSGCIRLGSEEAGWLQISDREVRRYSTKPFTGINFTINGEDAPMEMQGWNGQEWIQI